MSSKEDKATTESAPPPPSPPLPQTTTETLHGGCHCKRVRFSCQVSPTKPLLECNCSRCSMLGYLHLIVPSPPTATAAEGGESFHLTPGSEEALTKYQFNTHTAKHLFCKYCGVQAFYHPRSHPEGVSVNARCLDGGVPPNRAIQPFNGKEWEANIEQIR